MGEVARPLRRFPPTHALACLKCSGRPATGKAGEAQGRRSWGARRRRDRRRIPFPPCRESLFEPGWARIAALLPVRPAVSLSHRLGRHRRRVPDWVVFAHVVGTPVYGSGDDLFEALHALTLAPDDLVIGLDLGELCADGCVTKGPAGGLAAGRSPEVRGKQGLKRSVVIDTCGAPLHPVAAGANRHDALLLGPTLAGLAKLGLLPAGVALHLDRGEAGAQTRTLPVGLGFAAIARKGDLVGAGPDGRSGAPTPGRTTGSARPGAAGSPRSSSVGTASRRD